MNFAKRYLHAKRSEFGDFHDLSNAIINETLFEVECQNEVTERFDTADGAQFKSIEYVPNLFHPKSKHENSQHCFVESVNIDESEMS